MQVPEILNLCGISFNLIGSILLAISLARYLTTLHGAIVLHDLTILGLTNQQRNVPVATGVDKLLRKGVNSGRFRTTIGLIFLIGGFVLQLVPFAIKILNK